MCCRKCYKTLQLFRQPGIENTTEQLIQKVDMYISPLYKRIFLQDMILQVFSNIFSAWNSCGAAFENTATLPGRHVSPCGKSSPTFDTVNVQEHTHTPWFSIKGGILWMLRNLYTIIFTYILRYWHAQKWLRKLENAVFKEYTKYFIKNKEKTLNNCN